MRQLVYTVLVSNNRASFHLWWKENLINIKKSQNFMKMIVALAVKFPALIPNYESYSAAVSDIWSCWYLVFKLFSLALKERSTFHRRTSDYSWTDYDGFHNHPRDIPWCWCFRILWVSSGWDMYISLIINITLSFVHLQSFLLLVLLP